MAGETSASALQAGYVELASIVRALHGDWSAPADGYDGWTCHDLLAHLSSTQGSLPTVAASATGEQKSGAEPFDADRWNRSQVRKRAEKDPQELLDEFDMGTTRLVEVLTDTDLAKPVTIGAYPGHTLGSAMAEMLEHQRKHLGDLREALHAHPEQ
jgi:mycothiol maleylpyruvate isomerase-like protein